MTGGGLMGKLRKLLRGYSAGLSAAGFPPEVSGSQNTISTIVEHRAADPYPSTNGEQGRDERLGDQPPESRPGQ